jgi:hypothetical protein
MTRFWLGLGTLSLAFVVAGGCSGSSMPDTAPGVPGTEGHACRTDGTAPCDAPLSCFSNLCVNAGAATGTGGTGSGTGGTDATGSGGTEPTSSGGSDATGSGGTEPNGEAGSDGTGATGAGGETDPGVGGSTGNPGDLDCSTEGDYIICSNAGLDWEEAQAYCVSQGAALVKIDNADENNEVAQLVNEEGSTWIGANDRDTEGDFRWTDGSQVTGENAHWQDGQPNDADGEDCAVLHSSADWNDVDCALHGFSDDHQMTFVCEKP